MADGSWSLAEAKARFSEVVEKALTEGPQRVSRHGRPAVVVVREDAWAGKSKPLTLYDFFATSPLWDSDVELEHIDSRFRDLDI